MTPTEQQLNDAVENGLNKCFYGVRWGDLNYIRGNILSELKPLFDGLVKDKERLDWLNIDQCWKGAISNPTKDQKSDNVRTSIDLRIEEWLAEGRPHGCNAAYPDGCECELCELWDSLNKNT